MQNIRLAVYDDRIRALERDIASLVRVLTLMASPETTDAERFEVMRILNAWTVTLSKDTAK